MLVPPQYACSLFSCCLFLYLSVFFVLSFRRDTPSAQVPTGVPGDPSLGPQGPQGDAHGGGAHGAHGPAGALGPSAPGPHGLSGAEGPREAQGVFSLSSRGTRSADEASLGFSRERPFRPHPPWVGSLLCPSGPSHGSPKAREPQRWGGGPHWAPLLAFPWESQGMGTTGGFPHRPPQASLGPLRPPPGLPQASLRPPPVQQS